jgi:glycerol-3-phosphate dehydrogenase (NAD(P)+)
VTARIAVLGRGAWGSALAKTLSEAGRQVTTWSRNADDTVLCDADIVLAATPAQSTREVLARVKPAMRPDALVVLTAKGLESGTLLRQSQIANEVLPAHPLAVLSGPGFAADLTAGLPTALTLACNSDAAEDFQHALATPSLRPYLSQDLTGTELGGALKNVIAIACGIAIGAGLGESARAALMARGYAEMQRIAMAHGARAETLGGLSGLGDLTLTCTSRQSRNFAFGLRLGEAGGTTDTGTIEGKATATAAYALATKLNIEAPIIAVVAAVISGAMTVQDAIEALYNRPLRRE